MGYTILLGVPSSGVISEETAQASYHASLHHQVHRQPSTASGPNFNRIWCAGLNAGRRGLAQRLAMLHADVTVIEREENMRWLDILCEEMDRTGADFISVPNAIKGPEKLVSSGVGDPATRWNPWRRFTTYQLDRLPQTFSATDIGYGDKYLLHNHACCLWNLESPLWYETDADSNCRAIFNFTERIWFNGEDWICDQDSEDWAFSRQLWEIGAKTYMTTRILLKHHGRMDYENWGDGLWIADESTYENWKHDAPLGQNAAARVRWEEPCLTLSF